MAAYGLSFSGYTHIGGRFESILARATTRKCSKVTREADPLSKSPNCPSAREAERDGPVPHLSFIHGDSTPSIAAIHPTCATLQTAVKSDLAGVEDQGCHSVTSTWMQPEVQVDVRDALGGEEQATVVSGPGGGASGHEEEVAPPRGRLLACAPVHHGAPRGRPPHSGSLRVTIISANGLRNADWGSKSDPYCVCQIPGKPQSKFQTPVISDNLDPVWNYEDLIVDYIVGDLLEFTVWDQDWGKPDDFLGKATLSSTEFLENGFEGDLLLQKAGAGVRASLRVRVAASSDMPLDRPFFTAPWPCDRAGIGGMRSDFPGEVGFAFAPRAAVAVTALGRQAGPGPTALRGPARVTLWCAVSRAPLASESVGPGCAVEGGYAYAALRGAPVRLEGGREYRLSQQCTDGMPDPWFDGAVTPTELDAGAATAYAEFRGSVFCNGYGFPDNRDDDNRFPTQYRRAGMLNFKMMLAPNEAPLTAWGKNGACLRDASSTRLHGPDKGAQRPDRLAIRLVCMSPSP